MTQETASDPFRRWLAPPLVIFVLISIGFALGRLSASRSSGPEGATTDNPPTEAQEARVLLRYFHGDIRCVTCNHIEAMLRDCLDRHYAEAMAAGHIVFSTVNFDQDESLAARYDISSSIPLLAYEKDGEEQGAHQLDAVWELKGNQEFFDDYVIEEVDAACEAAGLADCRAIEP